MGWCGLAITLCAASLTPVVSEYPLHGVLRREMLILLVRPGVWSIDRCETRIAVARGTGVRVAVAEQIPVGSVWYHMRREPRRFLVVCTLMVSE